MFTQAHQHGLVQVLPDTVGIPVTQTPPASHAAAVAQGLRKVFLGYAGVKHKQDAIEGCLIAHAELACATFGRRCEGWNQGLQLSPQFVTNGFSCRSQREVVLATLRARGSLTVWLDKRMAWFAAASGKRGRSSKFSDAAIQFCLTLKNLFGLALRQTTGLVQSMLQLSGLAWSVPDFSTLCPTATRSECSSALHTQPSGAALAGGLHRHQVLGGR